MEEAPHPAEIDRPVPTFTPVPLRARHDGWTPRRQEDFIEALRRTRSVDRAAAAVRISRMSAYRLRARPGAASFAAAWDAALFRPQSAASVAACARAASLMDRALNGRIVPIMHKGRQVGYRVKPDNVALMAILRRFDRARGPDAA